MSSLEKNKIFAAFLSAFLVVMISGFIANLAINPKELKEDAVAIESADGAASGHGGVKKPAGPEDITNLLAAGADVERGAKIAKACLACHAFEKAGAVKQGPPLWNMINKAKASFSGFAYSDAMKEAGGTWDYDALNAFLWKPKKTMPGTKMNFAGVKKPNDRAALIAWLREQADAPAALPAPVAEEEPEAEAVEGAATEGEAAETEAPVVEEAPAH